MMDIEKLIADAGKSKFALWKLNFAFLRGIPFNKPHNLEVIGISGHETVVRYPYKRSNLNHIKGLHACGLATAAEYAAGLTLLAKLGASKYRFILESLEMKYHYQGKKDAIAKCAVDEESLRKEVIEPLATDDAAYIKCEVKVYDVDGNHLCTGISTWQIKRWEKVKTDVESNMTH
jgi:acyl-coenzyme A thioesterase PaaI-like protein